jgi:hypothetical protein
MLAVLSKFLLVARSRLKSQGETPNEILVLLQQPVVLSRKSASRVRLRTLDRLILVWLYRLCPLILNAIPLVKPENRYPLAPAGLPAYWNWRIGGACARTED